MRGLPGRLLARPDLHEYAYLGEACVLLAPYDSSAEDSVEPVDELVPTR